MILFNQDIKLSSFKRISKISQFCRNWFNNFLRIEFESHHNDDGDDDNNHNNHNNHNNRNLKYKTRIIQAVRYSRLTSLK